jgi:hypothetical protein
MRCPVGSCSVHIFVSKRAADGILKTMTISESPAICAVVHLVSISLSLVVAVTWSAVNIDLHQPCSYRILIEIRLQPQPCARA